MSLPMIQTQSLVKKFGHLTALNGIDLTIQQGEVVALSASGSARAHCCGA